MKKYFLLILLAAFSMEIAQAQNVFSPTDPVNNPPGTPPVPADGIMAKWFRTKNSGRINWDDTNFKCYIWNGMAFRLRFPKNYDPSLKYPMILFLHGGGEASHSLGVYENEDQLFWGAKLFEQRLNTAAAGNFNGFLLFPQQLQTAAGGWDNFYFPRVNDVLDSLTKNVGFDPSRLILMGLSEGGAGDVNYALLYPKRCATVVASSPIGIPGVNNSYIHIPMWISYGGDDTNPFPHDVTTFNSNFWAAGGNLYTSFYPTFPHDTWEEQWAEDDVYNNLLLTPFWTSAHKAQPLVFSGNSQFCAGGPISAKMGITPGFNAYQWQKNTTGTFVDIPGPAGTVNEFTATEAGLYRVRYQFQFPSNPTTLVWSDWTPNPVAITTKPCSPDTLLAEHFSFDANYLHVAPTNIYKEGNFDCLNSIPITGTENFVSDATGVQGGKFLLSVTNSGGNCAYSVGDRIWGTFQNEPTVLPNTNYVFSYSIGAQTTTNLTRIVPNINGVDLITSPAPPNNFSTPQPSGTGDAGWVKYSYIWNSGSNPINPVGLFIKNNSTTTNGNDFAIDEISFTRLRAPGNIAPNLKMWVKGDNIVGSDGFIMPGWTNNAIGTNLLQTIPINRPQFRNNSIDNINFNPTVNFDVTNNQNLKASAGFLGTTAHTAVHLFVVAESDNLTQNSDIVLETAASSTRMSLSLTNGGNVVWKAGATATNLTVNAVNELNKPILWSCSKDDANTPSGNKRDIRKNGLVIGSNNTTESFTGNSSNLQISGLFDGTVAEAVYYTDVTMNAAAENKIESYLATKYGLTLGNTGVGNQVNYTNAAGTTFWTGSSIYQNDVFGIGTDLASGLNQFQSNSVNSGSGNGTGQVNKGNLILKTASPLPDGQFFMIGNDAGVLTDHSIAIGEAPIAAVGGMRVTRNWKVQKTGAVGAVTLVFDTTGLTLSSSLSARQNITNFGLLIDNDGDGNYTTGTQTIIYASSGSGKKIYFNGVNFSTSNPVFTILTLRSPNNPLPATWLGFTAEPVNGKGLLNWKTGDEINVDYYNVEQSENGIDFTAIGTIPANNSTGTNNYALTTQLLSSGVHYYRIRRVDRDGRYEFSVVRTLKINATQPIVEIRPNPVRGTSLIMGISTQQSTPAQIYIVGMDGKRLVQQNTNLVQGVNTVDVNIGNVPAGIYLVQLQFNNEVVSKKFVRL